MLQAEAEGDAAKAAAKAKAPDSVVFELTQQAGGGNEGEGEGALNFAPRALTQGMLNRALQHESRLVRYHVLLLLGTMLVRLTRFALKRREERADTEGSVDDPLEARHSPPPSIPASSPSWLEWWGGSHRLFSPTAGPVGPEPLTTQLSAFLSVRAGHPAQHAAARAGAPGATRSLPEGAPPRQRQRPAAPSPATLYIALLPTSTHTHWGFATLFAVWEHTKPSFRELCILNRISR